MKWGDLISLEYGRPVEDKDRLDGKWPVFGTNGKIGTTNLLPLCNHQTMILGRKGAYRGVHYSDGPCSVIDTAFYTELHTNAVDMKWVYYKFLTYNINRMDSGSAIPSTDRYAIYAIDVEIPEIETQKKIVKILEGLDKKISLNQRINDNLLAQVKAIFQKNIIDATKHHPEWEQKGLLDIADYLNGLAMQKYRPKPGERSLPVLKIKELRQGLCDSTSEVCSAAIDPKYIVNDGDIIFSWSGSLLVDIWCGGVCGLNQHLFKVTSEQYDKWFYYLWTTYHLGNFIAIAADKATTMGHIKRSDLQKATVYIPSAQEYAALGKILQPMIDTIIQNRIESRNLSVLRDILLPKLMSGEVDVSHIQI